MVDRSSLSRLRELGLQFVHPADPGPSADQVQSNGSRNEQRQRDQHDQGKAGDIGLERRQAQNRGRRLFEHLQTIVRARLRGDQEHDRRRPRGGRPVKRSRSPAEPGEHPRAEPPHR